VIWRRYPERREVLVTTKTDRTFRGVLWQRRWGYIVLRRVELLKGSGEVTALTGEIVIESANIDFLQVM